MRTVTARSSLIEAVKSGRRRLVDYFHYRPRPGFKPHEVCRGRFSSREMAETIRRDGVCMLERYLDDRRVETLRREVDRIVVREADRVRRDESRGSYDYNGIDFRRYSAFLDLVLDELILAALEDYYRKPVYLAFSKVQRLEPTSAYRDGSFRWHHDSKGKYLKAMWLLTDVPVEGQRMSYVVGSHRIWRDWTTYEETRVPESDAICLGPQVECAGPAGSVVVFDTNGVHSGNRNSGSRRDVAFGIYSAGRHLQGCDFNLADLDRLTAWQKDVLVRSAKPTVR